MRQRKGPKFDTVFSVGFEYLLNIGGGLGQGKLRVWGHLEYDASLGH